MDRVQVLEEYDMWKQSRNDSYEAFDEFMTLQENAKLYDRLLTYIKDTHKEVYDEWQLILN